jgi:histidine triad (HIT) family protein
MRLDPDCPFCQIVEGVRHAHILARDARTTAFLDLRPINPGHTLVIPNEHEPDFFKLPDDLYGEVTLSAKRLAGVLAAVTQPRKVGLIIAGFDVPHTHIHVVPMRDYHDITSQAFADPDRVLPTDEQLAEMAGRVRREMQRQG